MKWFQSLREEMSELGKWIPFTSPIIPPSNIEYFKCKHCDKLTINSTSKKIDTCVFCLGKVNPLINIELDDINSVPKVFYKGKEIDGKMRVSFDWETDSDELTNTYIHIEHFEDKDRANTLSITHNRPIELGK